VAAIKKLDASAQPETDFVVPLHKWHYLDVSIY
jgi:hypothetical protein